MKKFLFLCFLYIFTAVFSLSAMNNSNETNNEGKSSFDIVAYKPYVSSDNSYTIKVINLYENSDNAISEAGLPIVNGTQILLDLNDFIEDTTNSFNTTYKDFFKIVIEFNTVPARIEFDFLVRPLIGEGADNQIESQFNVSYSLVNSSISFESESLSSHNPYGNQQSYTPWEKKDYVNNQIPEPFCFVITVAGRFTKGEIQETAYELPLNVAVIVTYDGD